MAISTSALGLNARNYLYIRKFNRRKYKLMADDKLITKIRLDKASVPTTKLITSFDSLEAVRHFDWKTLPESFVLKPALGYGGRGIMVVDKWDGEKGESKSGNVISINQLESEIFGTLDGAYSLNNLPDSAFFEEKVKIHSFFKKYTVEGVPDLRIIILNKIPIMAMLRLPTVYSGGRANLSQGAVGLGIDLRTGITTYAIYNGHQVENIPGKKMKVRGIKIPQWKKVLNVAVEAQVTSKLGFAGVDIVLDEDKGPLVLEINARPGLSIQVANDESLRTRLDRIENMTVPSVERGIELAQTLFAEPTLNQVDITEGILGVIEKVTIYGTNNKKKTVRAKIDTGAYRTSLDEKLVKELDLNKHDKKVHVKAGSGQQHRHTAKIKFKLRDKEIKTLATYTERSHMRFPMIVGRRDLKGFLVNPSELPKDADFK